MDRVRRLRLSEPFTIPAIVGNLICRPDNSTRLFKGVPQRAGLFGCASGSESEQAAGFSLGNLRQPVLFQSRSASEDFLLKLRLAHFSDGYREEPQKVGSGAMDQADRPRHQVIACQHCVSGSSRDPESRLSAADRVSVNQIVVKKAGEMREFDRRRAVKNAPAIGIQRPTKSQCQESPEHFAAGDSGKRGMAGQ